MVATRPRLYAFPKGKTAMRFRGDLMKDGRVIQSGVEGACEDIGEGGFSDCFGWVAATLQRGSLFRLKLEDGEEFGIMIAQTEQRNGSVVSHFQGEEMAS
jgi:hypothetical protein